MSTEIVQRTPQAELVSQIRSDHFRDEVSLALPENVTPERFVRVAITAMQASPSIAELERQSVLRSLLQSAAMGLLPDGREAAIVPFKGKAQLIPMIAGFRKIAADYGWTIYTTIAYANDEFSYEQGLDVRFRHVPVRPGADRGDPIAAYAVGKHQDGRRELEVLTVEEVEKIRATSQTARKEDGPWTQWWEQMAEKSAGKRLFKKLPLSDDDKRVRIVRASIDPSDAATAMYGEDARAALVNPTTGELPPAPLPADVDGDRGHAVDGQQAEGVTPVTDEPKSAVLPQTPSAPDPEEETLLTEASADDPSLVTIPAGANKGLTLAEVAAKGADGEQWLAWAAKNAASASVGPKVHAALQHFRTQLFEPTA